MIDITIAAAEEIGLSLHNPDAQGMLLRIAVSVDKDSGAFEYLFGLDGRQGNDIHLESNGIEYVVAYEQKALLDGMVLDYDKVNEEQGYCFIFMNPNDPNYVPPENNNAPQANS